MNERKNRQIISVFLCIAMLSGMFAVTAAGEPLQSSDPFAQMQDELPNSSDRYSMSEHNAEYEQNPGDSRMEEALPEGEPGADHFIIGNPEVTVSSLPHPGGDYGRAGLCPG